MSLAGRFRELKEQLQQQAPALAPEQTPVITVDSAGEMALKIPAIQPGERPCTSLTAYGGVSYARRNGGWSSPGSPRHIDGIFDRAVIGDRDSWNLIGSLAFGCVEKAGGKYLLLNTIINESSRGGYPAPFLFDPGPEIWKQAGGNSALVIRNIMADPLFLKMAFYEIDKTPAQDFKNLLMSRIEQSCWDVRSLPVMTGEEARLYLKDIPRLPERPQPETIAAALQAIPRNDRESFRFMIGTRMQCAKEYGLNDSVYWNASAHDRGRQMERLDLSPQ